VLTFRCCIACVCGFLFVGLGASASQTISPPPGSLPVIFLETDISPGVGINRAAWIWDGQHYQATWENGGKAEMTIESAVHGALVIRRTDTAGAFAGLTGKYIGKWDGHQISDAAFSWKLHDQEVTQTWTAFGATIPVTCEDSGHGFKVLHGWLPQLRAWVFQADAGGQTFYDKDVIYAPEGRNGIGAFQGNGQRYLNIGVMDVCVNHIPGHVTEATFANGSAFGDRKLIAAIEAQRLKEERQYLHAETRLCQLLGQGTNAAAISAALKAEKSGNDPAVELATRSLDKVASSNKWRTYRLNVPDLLKLLGDRRRLAMGEAVRDANGKLYISDSEADPVCDATGK
jgi:hypothetical protein